MRLRLVSINIPCAPFDTSHGVLELFRGEFLHLPLERHSAAKHGREHGLIRANAVVCPIK
jgi:hypothetical protein